MNRTLRLAFGMALLLGLVVALVPDAAAYCLTGVRWPDNLTPAPVYYNGSGKVTSGQCISASQMDSAVISGINSWRAINHAGSTTKTGNKRDGVNVVSWANLGGQTLGITNYLKYDRQRTVSCGGNLFANLFEADVRITTAFRWTSGGGQCPCAAGSAFYLNGVSEHEFGHVIGLCHTNQPSSLMYPSFGVCENKSAGGDENSGENALCY
jgi:matrixin